MRWKRKACYGEESWWSPDRACFRIIFNHRRLLPPHQIFLRMREGRWFRTGDYAQIDVLEGVPTFKILGRISSDILKCNGFKISALEIERALLSHAAIQEIAVAGIPDEVSGQKIGAWVVLYPNAQLTAPEIQSWCRDQLSPEKIPHHFIFVSDLPRNVMGKVNKKLLTFTKSSL